MINPGEAHSLRPYWEYLCYLFRRVEGLSPAELLESGYRDYLQVCPRGGSWGEGVVWGVWGWGGV